MVTYKTLIVLPDGTELFSGADTGDNIRSCTITYASNDGDDLILGSVCTALLEARIQSPGGDFSVAIGDVLTVYKVDESGARTQIGVFNVEIPTKVSKHIYKITAYDNVRLLDKDLAEWVRGLSGWPYTVGDFYEMICEECGVKGYYNSLKTLTDFKVYQFDVEDGTTGRQLVGWTAEVLGNYCIALPDGTVSCNWYSSASIYLYPTTPPGDHYSGEQYYFQGTLSHEDFEVKDIDAVVLREDDSASSALWPVVNAANPYIITKNPIFHAHPTYLGDSAANYTVRGALGGIKNRFNYKTFRPFKVTIPEFLDARIGKHVVVYGGDGAKAFDSYVTSLTWTGHKMVLECTAKKTRENATSPENMSNKDLMKYSDTAIERTEQDVLYSKLASDSAGLHCEDGEFYADPSFIRGNMVSDLTQARYYSADDRDTESKFEAWLDEQLAGMADLTVKDIGFTAYPVIPNGNTICARLYKFSDKYASLLGFAYSVPTLYHKAKKNGVWSATVSGSIVQTTSIEEVSTT